METIKLVKRTTKEHGTIKLRFRLLDGRGIDLFHKSDIIADLADLKFFGDDGKFIKNARELTKTTERRKLERDILDEVQTIREAYQFICTNKLDKTSEELERQIKILKNPAVIDKSDEVSIYDALNEFIRENDMTPGSKKRFEVLNRSLKRFALYTKRNLTFDNITPGTLKDFEKYLQNEHTYFDSVEEMQESGKMTREAVKFEKIMEEVPHTRRPVERGNNTIHDIMSKFRTFFRWANGLNKESKPNNAERKYTTNNPFDDYSVAQEVYGTPYYLTVDERNKLLTVDLPERLQKQRDIFVFQCVIGCRVSDLWAMTKANVINGGIEYIARKTKGKRPETTRVVLNKVALDILEKYKDYQGGGLFPFTSQQHYNIDIKEIIRLAGIDRMVTVLNPLTGLEEQKPIYEVASSHMARRTFIGNLYSKVKDPNLIGSMTGHAPGSRSFARYRNIDDDVKKDVVSLIE